MGARRRGLELLRGPPPGEGPPLAVPSVDGLAFADAFRGPVRAGGLPDGSRYLGRSGRFFLAPRQQGRAEPLRRIGSAALAVEPEPGCDAPSPAARSVRFGGLSGGLAPERPVATTQEGAR